MKQGILVSINKHVRHVLIIDKAGEKVMTPCVKIRRPSDLQGLHILDIIHIPIN